MKVSTATWWTTVRRAGAARPHVLSVAMLLAAAGVLVWHATACDAACEQDATAMTLDGAAPDGPNLCSACLLGGSCEVTDAGPPVTVTCFYTTCAE